MRNDMFSGFQEGLFTEFSLNRVSAIMAFLN